MARVRYTREQVARFDGLVENLKKASATLDGRNEVSVYDRLELHPGYDQLQHHLDRALHWAEEMQLIIAEELAPLIMVAERAS